jgi:pyruvate formate lyase activating enzyme
MDRFDPGTICPSFHRPVKAAFPAPSAPTAGTLRSRAESGKALAHMYLDPLPTNCCAAWFCSGSEEKGYNLAVFFYGCNFDCLFCQNASHKRLDDAPEVSAEEMVQAALDPQVRCVCFFGGSPEPQLSFALEVSKRIVEESGNSKHICFEWNGCGKPDLAVKAAELALQGGGTIKFDLKAYSRNVGRALCGVPIERSFENFSMLSDSFRTRNFLTATTLLVPFYLDGREVGGIAGFLNELNPEVPYSLLIFHPDFFLRDLPVTPKAQVVECYDAARQKLRRVNLGNNQLLGL